MSRLDRHVALVQNKLAVQRFVDALGRALPVVAVVACLTWLLEKQTTLAFEQKLWWIGGAGAALVIALGYAVWRRPSNHDAAVAIDERLGLKEKFSTALAVRHVNDPFAAAAVRDAEHTADNVSLAKRFPLAPPQTAHWGVWAMLIVVVLAAWWLPQDLFGRQAKVKEQARIATEQLAARQAIDDDIAKVQAIAKALPNAEGIAEAVKELEKLKMADSKDVLHTRRSAAEVLSGLDKNIQNQIAQSKEAAEAAQNNKVLKGLKPGPDDKGPVADAHKALAKGDVDQAIKDLGKAVKDFDKMDEKQKKEAAQQMQALANQLAQQNNPDQQKQDMAKQLQNAGMNQQQAQQMAQQIQNAAAGDKAAQQALQQQAQQAMQQMNGGAGPTPQQQQALQQMMAGMQAQAQGQMTAQQMAQAAQQMAQAMNQAAQQGGQQNPNGQPQGQNQGQAGANQQQMQAAAQAMQDQLAQMDAVAKDAQQQAAAGQQAQQAAAEAAGQCNNPGGGQGQNAGQNPGKPGGGKGQNGQWAQGDPGQGGKGQGFGGPGQAAGGSPGKEEAPFDLKQEISPSQNNEDGKFIAATFVKAGSLRGESLAKLQEVSAAAERTETDDVDAERISGEAKKAVKGYFGQLSGQEPKK